jgi:hypothetical protein
MCDHSSYLKYKFEGSEKVTRGGGECEPIKIHRVNLTYVSNQTRRPSLLTRSRPHSYRRAIDPQNRIRQNETQ